ncbi:MAG TPA: hypothetical protein VKR56_02625 [Candidatus Cybelea sp.]|nr:hypothetical protein [Candidatus Cybelea sp.]
MKAASNCAAAEILAGAIALGEAGDEQRHAYREHLSTCRPCLTAIGGEREIERVMNVVAQARDQERWQPDVRRALAHAPGRRQAWKWGAGLAVAAAFAVTILVTQRHAPVVVHSVAVQNLGDVAALGTQTMPQREHRAESIAFTSPQAARATITFEVRLDGRGKPAQCTVIKHSGRAALDAALCHAVLRAR